MSIVCRGRRYPNAPLWYLTGSRERLPPHFWFVNMQFLTGPLAHFNGFARVDPVDPVMGAKIKDPGVHWQAGGEGPATGTRQLFMEIAAGQAHMTLLVSILRVIGGTPFQVSKAWRKTEPLGFLWDDDAYHLLPHAEDPLWIFGGDDIQSVFQGIYGRLPPGSCTGA